MMLRHSASGQLILAPFDHAPCVHDATAGIAPLCTGSCLAQCTYVATALWQEKKNANYQLLLTGTELRRTDEKLYALFPHLFYRLTSVVIINVKNVSCKGKIGNKK